MGGDDLSTGRSLVEGETAAAARAQQAVVDILEKLVATVGWGGGSDGFEGGGFWVGVLSGSSLQEDEAAAVARAQQAVVDILEMSVACVGCGGG